MPAPRRQIVLLAVLLAVLASVLVLRWPQTPAASVPPPSKEQAARVPAESNGSSAGPAGGVKLDDLATPRPAPLDGDRNPFRFKPPPPPPPPPPVMPTPTPAVEIPTGPPPPPPITLKFIGVMELPERPVRLAVLTDQRGNVFKGVEGAIIDGRYRIVRIGVESIEMTYVDGSGRQVIRLSGQ
jgi:hypothetical protein